MTVKEVYQCQCENCQKSEYHPEQEMHHWTNLFLSRLNEQQRRWYVALEAQKIGHGGCKQMAIITGINVNTIRKGRREMDDDLVERPLDRDQQFRYIARVKKLFLQAGLPVISVDTKKKELIGNFLNPGRSWTQVAEKVNVHDFPQDAVGRAVPYGIYDLTHNQGYVYVGHSYDTPEFAACAIAQWWADPDRPRFQREDKLLILADAGGSNNCRYWLWKQQVLQQLADQFGIEVMICHYPTGASKWNPVEYRLFSQISCNLKPAIQWRGGAVIAHNL